MKKYPQLEFMPVLYSQCEVAEFCKGKYGLTDEVAKTKAAGICFAARMRKPNSEIVYKRNPDGVHYYRGRRASYHGNHGGMPKGTSLAEILTIEMGDGYFSTKSKFDIFEKLFGDEMYIKELYARKRKIIMRSVFEEIPCWHLTRVEPPTSYAEVRHISADTRRMRFTKTYAGKIKGLYHTLPGEEYSDEKSQVLRVILDMNQRTGETPEDWKFADDVRRHAISDGVLKYAKKSSTKYVGTWWDFESYKVLKGELSEKQVLSAEEVAERAERAAKAEQERLERERLAAEALAKEELEKAEKEAKKQAEKKAESERLDCALIEVAGLSYLQFKDKMHANGFEHPEYIGRYRDPVDSATGRSSKRWRIEYLCSLYQERPQEAEQIYDWAIEFGLLVRQDGEVVSVLDIPQEEAAAQEGL